eukprot:gnl/Spiro4/21344_TR10424_c0_g1_i1.p1 gnl/Spiro4/21344_TR10424_c0_g1~~gnl/Spiro4/21344_TR10424_c0_g1_i1.p1  ORF type:complete len:912 (+),score=235.92 gnl/Spiro4/21344_TR10424_c0_g1_i1:51-2738(+)
MNSSSDGWGQQWSRQIGVGCQQIAVGFRFAAVESNKDGNAAALLLRIGISGSPLLLLDTGTPGPVTALAFGEKLQDHGDEVLAVATPSALSVFSIDSNGDSSCRVVYAPSSPVSCACFDTTGTVVAAGTCDHVAIVDVPGSRCIMRLEGHAGRVVACAFSPHNKSQLVSIGDDRTFKVWDLNECAAVYSSAVFSGPLCALAVDPHVPRFAIGSRDGKVRFVEMMAPGFRVVYTLDACAEIQRCRTTPPQRTLPSPPPPPSSAAPATSALPPWHPLHPANAAAAATNERAGPLGPLWPLMPLGPMPWDAPADDSRCAVVVAATLALSYASHTPRFHSDYVRSLFISTSAALLQINCQTYELMFCNDFEFATASGADDSRVAHVSAAAFCAFAPHHTASVVAGTSADGAPVVELAVLAFQPLFESAAAAASTPTTLPTAGAAPPDVSALRQGMLWGARELPRESPLRNCGFKPAPSSSSGGARTKKKGPPAARDQPVTFRSHIKSSGYGAGPAVTRMHSLPKTKPSNNPHKPSKKKDPSTSAAACREYPSSCGLLQFFQPKHVLPDGVPLHSSPIILVSYSGDGQRVATVTARGVSTFRLPLCKYRAADASSCYFLGHSAQVNSVHWNSTSQLLVSGGADARAVVWRLGSSQPVLEIANTGGRAGTPLSSEVRAAQFFWNDVFLLLAVANRCLLFKYIAGESEDLTRLRNNCAKMVWHSGLGSAAQNVTALRALNCPRSSVGIVGASDRSLAAIDISVGCEMWRVPEAHARPVHALALFESPAGTSAASHDVFASAATDNRITMWDMRAARRVCTLTGHLNRTQRLGLALSPCGRYLAAASEDRSCAIYDVRTAAVMARLAGHLDTVSDVAYHPWHPQMVTASYDGHLRFYTDTSET